MSDNNLRPADLDTVESMIEALEGLGHRVVPPTQALNDSLRARMEGLARDLHVIGGMTKRGAVLPAEYREGTLQSLRAAFDNLFRALAYGQAVNQPWDKTGGV